MVQPQQEATNKPKALRGLLADGELKFLMEAHSPLSARIAEEVGFKALWASGFSISTALGRRDSNELTFTQVFDVLEGIADFTSVPVLVDGDTGWGNFNNLRQAVSKLCDRGLAGICIEDKLFPKLNSFAQGAQTLADLREFCGKIRAANDSKGNPDFMVVARTEALIAGASMDEALTRAEAYLEAGADAILIHSKRRDAAEIISFTARFGPRCPILIVPTTYHETDTDVFRRIGIAGVIWANHSMRASVRAMRDACRMIFSRQSVTDLEANLPSVKEIFDMLDYDELEAAERRYLA